MSLILEALKKSEAERRVGQPPGLLSPASITPAPRRSRLHWLGLLLVPALVLAAWWFGRSSVPAPPAPTVEQSSEAATVPGRIVEPPVQPAPAATPTARPAAVVPPRPALREPPPGVPQEALNERESRPMLPAEAELSLPQPAPLPGPAYSEVPAPTPGSPAGETTALPELRELPPALRTDLPPLKLSMHVYDADPARRFVLIDGRRLVEGDRIQEGLELVEIRRDGSVLSLRGERFLLPRP